MHAEFLAGSNMRLVDLHVVSYVFQGKGFSVRVPPLPWQYQAAFADDSLQCSTILSQVGGRPLAASIARHASLRSMFSWLRGDVAIDFAPWAQVAWVR